MTSRLTLNLGLRYDISKGQFAERVAILPWVRGGTSYSRRIDSVRGSASPTPLNDRTVIRGGTGSYFADVSDQVSSWTERYGGGEINAQVANDGRADFAGKPVERQAAADLRGSAEDSRSPEERLADCDARARKFPTAIKSSIGLQRQFGTTMALQADYVVNNSRRELFQRNINLTYNPATGVNYVSTDATRAVYADWGVVNAYRVAGVVQFSRAGNGVHQAPQSAVAGLGHAHAIDLQRWEHVTGPVSHARAGSRSRVWAGNDGPAPSRRVQRHLGRGLRFQLSGLYFYGSGQRFATTYGGGDRTRLRPDGSIVPRNNFVGLTDPPGGCAASAALRARRPPRCRRHPRGAQPVQPCELRRAHARGKQRELWAADSEHRHRAPAAHGAAGIPLRVLIRCNRCCCGRPQDAHGVSRWFSSAPATLPEGCAVDFLTRGVHLIDLARVGDPLERVGVEHDEIGALPRGNHPRIDLRDGGRVARAPRRSPPTASCPSRPSLSRSRWLK